MVLASCAFVSSRGYPSGIQLPLQGDAVEFDPGMQPLEPPGPRACFLRLLPEKIIELIDTVMGTKEDVKVWQCRDRADTQIGLGPGCGSFGGMGHILAALIH